MSAIVENAITTSETSPQSQRSVKGTESKSGYQILHATCDADDAILYKQESVITNSPQTDPQLLSNRGLINQSPEWEGSTAITITETSSHGGSVHPQNLTPEITELQEQSPAARPHSNQSPKPLQTLQTQFSIPESPLE